jgi:hypothetical protein
MSETYNFTYTFLEDSNTGKIAIFFQHVTWSRRRVSPFRKENNARFSSEPALCGPAMADN